MEIDWIVAIGAAKRTSERTQQAARGTHGLLRIRRIRRTTGVAIGLVMPLDLSSSLHHVVQRVADVRLAFGVRTQQVADDVAGLRRTLLRIRTGRPARCTL